MATKLISSSELKTYLDFSGTGSDSLLDELIEHASSQIEVYCDRLFSAETGRVEYPIGGFNALHLKLYPITTITSIYEDAQRAFGSGTLVAAAEYYSSGDAGNKGLVIRKANWRRELYPDTTSRWINGRDVLKVTYDAGYTVASGVTAVPDDLKKACIRQVSYLYDRHRGLGTTSASGGDGSASFIGGYDLLAEVTAVLQKYRRVLP